MSPKILAHRLTILHFINLIKLGKHSCSAYIITLRKPRKFVETKRTQRFNINMHNRLHTEFVLILRKLNRKIKENYQRTIRKLTCTLRQTFPQQASSDYHQRYRRAYFWPSIADLDISQFSEAPRNKDRQLKKSAKCIQLVLRTSTSKI